MMWNFAVASLIVVLGLLIVSAGIEDARTREIANGKNAAIALLAPLFWIVIGLDPWPDMVLQIVMAAIVLALFCVAFHFGWMGGGDVKMIAALALWLPLGSFVTMLMVMSIAGGAITLLMMIERTWRKSAGTLEIPYGVAIAFAALLALREPLLNHFP